MLLPAACGVVELFESKRRGIGTKEKPRDGRG